MRGSPVACFPGMGLNSHRAGETLRPHRSHWHGWACWPAPRTRHMLDQTDEVEPPLVATGIAGLDDILRGGLTPRRLYLVEGNPGSGKTTLALQFLMEGMRRGESTLYVTLSETKRELVAVAA